MLYFQYTKDECAQFAQQSLGVPAPRLCSCKVRKHQNPYSLSDSFFFLLLEPHFFLCHCINIQLIFNFQPVNRPRAIHILKESSILFTEKR